MPILKGYLHLSKPNCTKPPPMSNQGYRLCNGRNGFNPNQRPNMALVIGRWKRNIAFLQVNVLEMIYQICGGFIRIHNFVNIIFEMNWLALQHLLFCPNFIPFLRLKKKISNHTVGSRFSEGFTYFTDSIPENNGFLNLTSILACFNSKVSLLIEGLWAAIHVIGPQKIWFDNKTLKKRRNRGNMLWLLWT